LIQKRRLSKSLSKTAQQQIPLKLKPAQKSHSLLPEDRFDRQDQYENPLYHLPKWQLCQQQEKRSLCWYRFPAPQEKPQSHQFL
jgi:hypothetical protein